MIIAIAADSSVPPFEQLRDQITSMIRSGTLPAGHRLPSVRQLAKDLALANGTVARTYRELEAQGLVHTNGRHGTEVAAVQSPARAEQRALLDHAAEQFSVTARQIGATDQQIRAALKRAGIVVAD